MTCFCDQDISALCILGDRATTTSCAASCEKRGKIHEFVLRDSTDYEGPDLGPSISLENTTFIQWPFGLATPPCLGMGGWVDGWMGGWVDGWRGGGLEGWKGDDLKEKKKIEKQDGTR